jgi:hypothetical protein
MSSVNCEQCGSLNQLAVESCASCGAELRSDAFPFNAGAAEGAEPATVIGPFTSVGAALDPAVTIFTKNIWLIARIVFVIFAPFEIFKALSFGRQQPGWQVMAGTFLLGIIAKALVAPSLIYALVVVMRTGVAPGLHDSYRWGLSRLWKVMACAGIAWALELVGFALLIIPGIILSLAFALIFPMATLEDRGPVEIIKRSYELTKGYRGRIFFTGLVMTLICSFVGMPVRIAWGILASVGFNYWPLQAGIEMIIDIINEALTVLSLVFYFGIMAHKTAEGTKPVEGV